MNPCSEEYELLCSLAADNALTPAEKRQLDAHLAECPACRAYLEDLRALRQMWKSVETPAPASVHEAIMGQITSEVRENVVEMPVHRTPRRVPVFTMLAAAAACVMLAASGNLTGLAGRLGNLTGGGSDTAVSAQAAADTAEDAAADNATARAVPFAAAEADAGVAEAAAEAPEETAPADGAVSDEGASGSDGSAAPRTTTGDSGAAPASSDSADSQTTANGSTADSRNGTAPRVMLSDVPAVTSLNPSNSGKTAVTALPSELSETAFAACYTATGTGELPAVTALTLLVEQDDVRYYALENNVSTMTAAFADLSEAGYTAALDEQTPIVLDRTAPNVLVIVRTTEEE